MEPSFNYFPAHWLKWIACKIEQLILLASSFLKCASRCHGRMQLKTQLQGQSAWGLCCCAHSRKDDTPSSLARIKAAGSVTLHSLQEHHIARVDLTYLTSMLLCCFHTSGAQAFPIRTWLFSSCLGPVGWLHSQPEGPGWQTPAAYPKL